MKRFFASLLFSALSLFPTSAPTLAQGAAATDASPRQVENEIASLINQYRRSLGLPPIPRSNSLDMVARTHAEDLTTYHPDQGTDERGQPCNAHSWSAHGNWEPVCYTADHAHAAGMWSKPRELTNGGYSANGYEIAMGGTGSISAQQALSGWQASAPHNAVMTEQGIWSGAHWQAMGVGVSRGYAVVWFGKEPDTAGR